MALLDIYNAVNLQVSVACAAVGLPAPAFAFGPAGRVAKASAPQISWVFGAERFGAAEPSAPIGSGRRGSSGVPRSLRTRVAEIEAHIWGTSGNVGPVGHQGPGSGRVALSATDLANNPPPFESIQFKLIAAGAAGVATFQFSLDFGATWSSTQTTGASVALPGTGLSAAFTGTFTTIDTYQAAVPTGALGDYATTELYLNVFVASLHQLLHGSYELLGGQWAGQDGSEMSQQGKLYVLRWAVKMPITEIAIPAQAFAQIGSTQQDVGTSFPDGQVIHGSPGA